MGQSHNAGGSPSGPFPSSELLRFLVTLSILQPDTSGLLHHVPFMYNVDPRHLFPEVWNRVTQQGSRAAHAIGRKVDSYPRREYAADCHLSVCGGGAYEININETGSFAPESSEMQLAVVVGA